MTDEILLATPDEAEWAWIKPHYELGAVFKVDVSLDLAVVGRALAEDDKVSVAAWVSQGLLARPTAEHALEWDSMPSSRFLCMVVQPFVLMQELKVSALH